MLFLCLQFYLQIKTLFLWACLDSNQGPLPYQRQKRLLWMFAVVQIMLQTGMFFFC